MSQSIAKRPLMIQGLLCSILLFGQSACQKVSSGPPALTEDNTPVEWRTDDLAGALYLDGSIEDAKVLAWEVVENPKKDRIESCLACFKTNRAGHSYWTLGHFYRWPKMRGSHHGWDISMVYDAPQVPEQEFDHRPDIAEAMKFVSDTWWDITRGPGGHQFRLVAKGICPNAWRWATGSVPEALPPPAFQEAD